MVESLISNQIVRGSIPLCRSEPLFLPSTPVCFPVFPSSIYGVMIRNGQKFWDRKTLGCRGLHGLANHA